MAAIEGVSAYMVRPDNATEDINIKTIELKPGPAGTAAAPGQGDYEPRDHRRPTRPISLTMAYFNVLKGTIGPGQITLPMVISQLGVITGVLLYVSVSCVFTYCVHLLLSNLNEVCQHLKIPHISYRYGFRLAVLHGPVYFRPFGRSSTLILTAFMFMSQLGLCCIYYIFIAENIRDLGGYPDAVVPQLILLLPLIIVVLFMNNLNLTGIVSIVGSVFLAIGLSTMFYIIYGMGEPANVDFLSTSYSILPYLSSIGIVLFCNTSIGTILSLDRALENPRHVTKPLGLVNMGALAPGIIGIVFGISGYWRFGLMSENFVRTIPPDEITSKIAYGAYGLSVFLTFPIAVYPAVEIMREVYKAAMESNHPRRDPRLAFVDYIFRPIFIIFTFLLSHLILILPPWVAFVGSLCTATLVLTFPALMHICLRHPAPRVPRAPRALRARLRCSLVKDTLLIVMGLSIAVVGVSISLFALYSKRSKFYAAHE